MAANQLLVTIFCGGLLACAMLNDSHAISQVLGAQPDSQVKALVGRLASARYKPTIHGLRQFADRQQATHRNRATLAWSDAPLKGSGRTNTELIATGQTAPA